jgi:hypothetical protein
VRAHPRIHSAFSNREAAGLRRGSTARTGIPTTQWPSDLFRRNCWIVAINPAKLVRGIDFPADQAELVQGIDRRVAVCFRYC